MIAITTYPSILMPVYGENLFTLYDASLVGVSGFYYELDISIGSELRTIRQYPDPTTYKAEIDVQDILRAFFNSEIFIHSDPYETLENGFLTYNVEARSIIDSSITSTALTKFVIFNGCDVNYDWDYAKYFLTDTSSKFLSNWEGPRHVDLVDHAFLQCFQGNFEQNEGGVFDVGAGFGGYVSDIVQNSDGDYYVVGNYNTFDGSTRNRIVKLKNDGKEDTSFIIGSGFSNGAFAVDLDGANRPTVGGLFSNYKDSSTVCWTRLSTNGTLYKSAKGVGFNNRVNDLKMLPDSTCIVVGNFTTYDGSVCNHIVELYSSGEIRPIFYNNMGGADASNAGFDDNAYVIEKYSTGKYIIGGDFSSYDSSTQGLLGEHRKLIIINSTGIIDTNFHVGTGFSGSVKALYVEDGKVLVGGAFTQYDSQNRYRIVKLNSDGTVDSTFVAGNGFDGTVLAISKLNDLYIIGGMFEHYKDVSVGHIIAIDSSGTISSAIDFGTGFDGDVYTIYKDTNNKLVIGGNFTDYNGTTANYIIRLNTDYLTSYFNGLKITKYLSNGASTFDSVMLTPDVSAKILSLNVGVPCLNSISDISIGEETLYYTIQEVNGKSEIIQFNIDKRDDRLEQSFRLAYVGSLGETEIFNFYKGYQGEIAVDREYFSKDRIKKIYNTSVESKMTCNSDWIGHQESESIKELFASPNVSIVDNDLEEIPIVINDKSVTILNRRNVKPINYELEFSYAKEYKVQKN
jgi:hypothetical protein